MTTPAVSAELHFAPDTGEKLLDLRCIDSVRECMIDDSRPNPGDDSPPTMHVSAWLSFELEFTLTADVAAQLAREITRQLEER